MIVRFTCYHWLQWGSWCAICVEFGHLCLGNIPFLLVIVLSGFVLVLFQINGFRFPLWCRSLSFWMFWILVLTRIVFRAFMVGFQHLLVFFQNCLKDSKCGFFNDHIPYKRLSYLNQEYYKGNHRHMHSIFIVNYFLISYNYYMCT